MPKVRVGKMRFESSRESDLQVVGGKGKQLYPRVILGGKIAHQWAGYHLIEADLEFAIAAMSRCGELPNRDDTTLARSLWLAGIVTYGKCFAEARGRNLWLDWKVYLRGATTAQLYLHHQMIKTRDEYVAHAGTCGEERAQAVLFLNPDLADKKILNLTVASWSAVSPGSTDLDGCIEVMRLVLKYVRAAGARAKAKLKLEVEAESLEKWYSRAKTPKVTGPILVPKLVEEEEPEGKRDH